MPVSLAKTGHVSTPSLVGSTYQRGDVMTCPRTAKDLSAALRIEYCGYGGAKRLAADMGCSVLHRCDNKRCIRASHLFVGTHQDNMDDKVRKDRTSKLRGEDHPGAKITADIARAIFLDNRPHAVLARQYDVTDGTIGQIRARIIWADATAGLVAPEYQDGKKVRAMSATHCKNGHPRSYMNTRVRNGRHECRVCDRDRHRDKYAQKKAREESNVRSRSLQQERRLEKTKTVSREGT